MNNSESLIAEQLTTLTDLYTSYLELSLNSFTFVLGICGAVVAYVIKERKTKRVVQLSLALPFTICLMFGIGFIYSVPKSLELTRALKRLQAQPDIDLVAHSDILTSALIGFGIGMILSALLLAIIPFKLDLLYTK